MSSSNNSGRTGSESLYPDSIHVRCAKGTGDRVHQVAEASFTSAPEWLRRVVLEVLKKEEKLVAPSPLEPSAGTRRADLLELELPLPDLSLYDPPGGPRDDTP